MIRKPCQQNIHQNKNHSSYYILIPFTGRPINFYKKEIITPHSYNYLLLSITTRKILENFRHIKNEITSKLNSLVPNRQYCHYFYNENDKSKIITNLQRNFKLPQLIISTEFLPM